MRLFDGVDDNISFGSDALVDNYASKTVLLRLEGGIAAGAEAALAVKSDGAGLNPTGWQFQWQRAAVGDSGHLRFTHDFATVDGDWVTANNSLPSAATAGWAVGVTYDRGNTANDPNIYIDGVLQAEAETTAPLGAVASDAAQNLRVGENDGGTDDFSGSVGWLVYDDTLMTAADVNRHRWYGVAPGGPSTVNVWIPMWTDSLANKGTVGAVADGVATGTTMASDANAAPRVERCWGSCLGVGR